MEPESTAAPGDPREQDHRRGGQGVAADHGEDASCNRHEQDAQPTTRGHHGGHCLAQIAPTAALPMHAIAVAVAQGMVAPPIVTTDAAGQTEPM